jgi:hypothetical protein
VPKKKWQKAQSRKRKNDKRWAEIKRHSTVM